MAAKTVRPLKDVSNVQMMDYIRSKSSPDYLNRIPKTDQAGYQDVVRRVTEYRPAFNEFVDGLVNQIGSVVARNISWTNPMAEFKRGQLAYGDTIQEIQMGLLKAHSYDPTRDALERDIFGTELPEVEANYHKINRRDFYKVSVNHEMLQHAFQQDGGLAQFVSQLMEAPTTSDQWDEFLAMTSLFAEYESAGGFFHVNVPDVTHPFSTADDAKAALRKIRAMSDTLPFVSTDYNAAGMPTFAKAEDLVIFTTPEFKAAVDVEALAAAFNMDRMAAAERIIPIPRENFAIPGAQAILASKDLIVAADSLLENTSQFNPVTLNNNYFLHHHQVISMSRFTPAVLFHTGSGDEVIRVSAPVTSVSAIVITDVDNEVVAPATALQRGFVYAASAAAVTTPEGGDNSAVRWAISGNKSLRTRITQTGTLFIGGDESAADDGITITATSTWLNPDNLREDGKTVTRSIKLTGESAPDWPAQGVIDRILIRDVPVAGFAPATLAYPSPVAKPITADEIQVFTDGPGSTKVTVNSAGTIATIVFDGGSGAAKTYTITAA